MQVTIFKTQVLTPNIVKILEQMLLQIGSERDGGLSNVDLLQNCICVFKECGVYQHFEEQMLNDTAKYYKKEALKYLADSSCSDYLKIAEKRLEIENKIADNYIEHANKSRLIETFIREFIENHSENILEKGTGVNFMIENKHFSDLRILFKLFKTNQGSLDKFRRKVKEFVIRKGSLIMKEENFIPSALSLREEMSELLAVSFNKEYTMDTCINDAFSEFINHHPMVVQQLCNFIDKSLRDPKQEKIEGLQLFYHIRD